MDRLEEVIAVLKDIIRSHAKFVLRESIIQDILAMELRGVSRKKLEEFLEVDVLAGNLALEVKLNARPYDGFAQALLYKELFGFESAVVHVITNMNDRFLKIVRVLVERLKIPCILAVLSEKRVLKISP